MIHDRLADMIVYPHARSVTSLVQMDGEWTVYKTGLKIELMSHYYTIIPSAALEPDHYQLVGYV